MTPAPTLTTQRLTLRGPKKTDLAAFTQWATTSQRMAAVGGNGTVQEAWRGFLAGIGHWHWHGYGFFMITDTATGQALGRIGILNHEGWPEPELAYHLFDGAEGQSIAYEAACAVRHWAGEALGLGPLISIIDPDNTRSRTLAERLGAGVETEGHHDDHPVLFYRHLPHTDATAAAQFAQVCR